MNLERTTNKIKLKISEKNAEIEILAENYSYMSNFKNELRQLYIERNAYYYCLYLLEEIK